MKLENEEVRSLFFKNKADFYNKIQEIFIILKKFKHLHYDSETDEITFNN